MDSGQSTQHKNLLDYDQILQLTAFLVTVAIEALVVAVLLFKKDFQRPKRKSTQSETNTLGEVKYDI